MAKNVKIIGFKIGDRVCTTKGCRIKGPSCGIIIGWSDWNGRPAANVKKDNGQVRQFHIANLVKASPTGKE